MSFASPYLLLTLLVVPAAVAAYYLAERRRMRYAVRYTNVDVLASVRRGREWRRYVAPTLALLALATLSVAVARPRVHSVITSDKATVVLVLDVSGSMHSTDVKPTRLAAAQAAIHSFLDHVPKRLKVGLVLFSAEAEVATPPTSDHRLVAQAVDNADNYQGFGGTAIGDAIAVAVNVGLQSAGEAPPAGSGSAAPDRGTRQLTAYAQPAAGKSLVSILFLSDGRQNRGILSPLQGAAKARDAGIPIFTIALGTTGQTTLRLPTRPGSKGGFSIISPYAPYMPYSGFAGLQPDPKTLHAIARYTGGEFFRAKTAGAAEAAYSKLGSSLGRRPGRSEVTGDFLAGALVLLLLGGGLSALRAPKLP